MRNSWLIISTLAFLLCMPTVESVFAATVPLRTVQCEVTNQVSPDTLWLGWPSTIGHLTAKTCTLTLLGNEVILTLPGTTTQTAYQLRSFKPGVPTQSSTAIPTTSATAVTLSFHNRQPILVEGGTEAYRVQYWTPKADGTTMTITNGLTTYRLVMSLAQ